MDKKISKETEQLINGIITSLGAFFAGGFYLMWILGIIMPLFHQPGLGYWTCATLMLLGSWTGPYIFTNNPLNLKNDK